MLKVLKNLKKTLGSVIAIVILLCVQAAADLALPDYTSIIVNEGIQAGGIVSSVPDIISKEDMDKILLFTENDDEILNNYTLVSSEPNEEQEKIINKYLGKDYNVENDTIYVLNNDTQMVSLSTEEVDKKMTNLGIFLIYFSPWFTSIHEETVNEVKCYVLQNSNCKLYINAETFLPIKSEEGSIGNIAYTDNTTITPLVLPTIATE